MNHRRRKKIDSAIEYFLMPRMLRAFNKPLSLGPRDKNAGLQIARKVRRATAQAIQKSSLGQIFREVPMMTAVWDEVFSEDLV